MDQSPHLTQSSCLCRELILHRESYCGTNLQRQRFKTKPEVHYTRMLAHEFVVFCLEEIFNYSYAT